jgi:ABC-2 type transport system permease protein
MSIGIFASVIAFQSLVREKTRGNIQALLATPLTPADLWLGKTLAVFAPGFVFAVIMTIAVFIVINSIYFIPEIGVVLTPGMLVSSLVVVPLVYFALMLLVHEIGISARPVTANILAQLFLPVVITLMINLVTRNVINAGSWLFTVVLLGLALLIGVFVLVLRSKLTVEKIILSQ